MADIFCQLYDRFIKINGLARKRDESKRKYHRGSTLSDAEVITIMILFHLCGYKCLKLNPVLVQKKSRTGFDSFACADLHYYLMEICVLCTQKAYECILKLSENGHFSFNSAEFSREFLTLNEGQKQQKQ